MKTSELHEIIDVFAAESVLDSLLRGRQKGDQDLVAVELTLCQTITGAIGIVCPDLSIGSNAFAGERFVKSGRP